MHKQPTKNVFDANLQNCSTNPLTGFYRDGYCNSGPMDAGLHLVCTRMTKDFLRYSKSKGNDLSTPRPESAFPGLKPGDNWCVCVTRWKEAFEEGVAPPLILSATNKKALDHVPIQILKKYSIDDAVQQTINFK